MIQDNLPSVPDSALSSAANSFHVVRGQTARHTAMHKQSNWLWHGYLAPGCLTMLTGPWKLGKTTLLAALLGRMATGGEIAGQPVRPGRAVVISDESLDLWDLRLGQFDIGDHVGLLCRPFRGQPLPQEWVNLVDYLVDLHQVEGLELVVIDSLASFVPGRDENNASCMMQTLAPLQRLTEKGVALMIVHHPRRKPSAPGHSMRGSGALPASVDILLEMDWFVRSDESDRRRQLRAFSRFPETPRRQVCEWSADGRDYRTLGDFHESAFTEGWNVLRIVLEDAPGKLKRQAVLDQWPPDYPRPDPASVWRWLEKGVARGLIHRDGAGRRNAPFRYWLPERLEQWKNDPMYMLVQQAEEDRENLEQLLGKGIYRS
ncbi:MAG: AAA family ATPase [Gemmataceae bacterium]